MLQYSLIACVHKNEENLASTLSAMSMGRCLTINLSELDYYRFRGFTQHMGLDLSLIIHLS